MTFVATLIVGAVIGAAAFLVGIGGKKESQKTAFIVTAIAWAYVLIAAIIGAANIGS